MMGKDTNELDTREEDKHRTDRTLKSYEEKCEDFTDKMEKVLEEKDFIGE
jgi:hypothetical protein